MFDIFQAVLVSDQGFFSRADNHQVVDAHYGQCFLGLVAKDQIPLGVQHVDSAFDEIAVGVVRQKILDRQPSALG